MSRSSRRVGIPAAMALGAMGALGVALASGAGTVTTAADMQAVGHGRPVDIAFGADRMTLSVRPDGTRHLSFSRMSRNVEVLGVSPSSDRATARIEHWAMAWKRLYGGTEPNIVVTSGKGWNRTRVSYTLAKARFSRAKGTMDFTLRPMFSGARGRPRLASAGTRRVKATRRQLGAGTVFVQQATGTRSRGGVDVTHSAGRIMLRTTRAGVRHLVLGGYSPTVELTAVAPAHDRITAPTAVWARGWNRLYGRAPRNAILSFGPRGSGTTHASVALGAPRFNPVKRTLDFIIHPVGDATLPAVAPGRSRALGAGLLFVDQTSDFGSNSAAQNQAAVNALEQAGMGMTVTGQSYLCCNSGMQPPDIENGLPSGEAYQSLMLQPGTVDTISFQGAPAFGSTSISGIANITFANGEDNDGATFGLSGPGAFTLAAGSTLSLGLAPNAPAGQGGTQNLVIYNGDFNGKVTGTLGSNSALVGGDMSGATISGLTVNDALLAGVSFDGATFVSPDSGTQFNDSALLGVSFEGANLQDGLAFYGTDLVALSTPSPTGEAQTTYTSFAGLKNASFMFAPSQTADTAASSSLISEVSFAGSSWDNFAVGNAVIQGSDFSNAALGFPVFTNSTIDNASDFTSTNLGRVQFVSCSLSGTDLTTAIWNTPVFTGTANAPTVLDGVTFSGDSFTNNSTKTMRATFEYVTFSGTTFVGLNPADASNVSFVSSIMTSTGVRTEGLGLIAFNTQYIQGLDADGTPTWFKVNDTGTAWTPIDPTTLAEAGPATNVEPAPVPGPDPGPDPAPAPAPEPAP